MTSITEQLRPVACEICGKDDSLYCCPRCSSTHYCGREHQLADWPHHAAPCESIKTARDAWKAAVREEESLEQAMYGQVLTLNFAYSHAFHDHLLRYVDALMTNFGSARTARRHVLRFVLALLDKMRRMTEDHNAHFQMHIPALHVRLRQEPQAYRQLKILAELARMDSSAWDRVRGFQFNFTAPYHWLDIAHPNADVLEPSSLSPGSVHRAADPTGTASNGLGDKQGHMILLLLVKARALVDLQAMSFAMVALRYAKLPEELIQMVRVEYVNVFGDTEHDLSDAAGIRDSIGCLKRQIRKAYLELDRNSSNTWKRLLSPCDVDVPSSSSSASSSSPPRDEAGLSPCCMASIQPAWAENPPAQELMRRLEQQERIFSFDPEWQLILEAS